MKAICIYHTRSGLSEQIALQIANVIGAEIMKVTDGKAYKGFLGYAAAAVAGLKKKFPVILPCTPEYAIEEYDKVIIVAPIWCENVSPVMRAFLAQNKNRFNCELFYVITNMSGLSYKAKIDALQKLTAKPYAEFLEVKTHKNDWNDEVAAFAEKLKK